MYIFCFFLRWSIFCSVFVVEKSPFEEEDTYSRRRHCLIKQMEGIEVALAGRAPDACTAAQLHMHRNDGNGGLQFLGAVGHECC